MSPKPIATGVAPSARIDSCQIGAGGEKAYETLKILDAKNTVHQEIGKK